MLVLVVEVEVVLDVDYDKAGGQNQGGGGGGSAGYVSDKIFSVTGGETISYSVGSGGGGGSVSLHLHQQELVQEATTTLSGSTSGSIFSITGGSGATDTEVAGFKALLATITGGSAGSASISWICSNFRNFCRFRQQC
jgi:hypothetical protein